MSFLDGIGKAFSGLFGAPKVPTVNLTASESKITAYDPRYPRQLCLGHSGWSTSVGWQRVHDFTTGSANPKEALTQVLCVGSHQMGALDEILIGDKLYTVGTDGSSGGDDFVPVSDDTTSFDWEDPLPAANWYVPNTMRSRTKLFRRLDGGIWRPVVAFKWFDGSQTTELRDDVWMDHISGWDNKTRDFRGEACLCIVWRRGVNEEVFSGSTPRLLPICDGAQDVYDWGTQSAGYRDNALDCFIHWLRWEYGPYQTVDDNWADVGLLVGSFDQTILSNSSNQADQDVDDGDRYDCAYQIASGADPQDVFDTFDFLCGSSLRIWQRANGLWATRVGSDRTAVAQFNLDQVAENIDVERNRLDGDRYNTLTVGYISDRNLYDMLEVEKTDNAYVAADGDEQVFETVTNRGRHGADSNQRLALIKLDRHRLEEAAAFDCWYHSGVVISGSGAGAAMRIEPGDIAELTYSKRSWVAKEFELVQKTFDPVSWSYRLEFAEWGGVRWDGEGDTPEEVGDDFGQWDGTLDPPTGLQVITIGQPSQVRPDGTQTVTALVDCDDHPETAIVGFLGGYAFRWRVFGGSDPKWTTMTSPESRAFANLVVGETYEFQAHVYGPKNIRSEWTEPPLGVLIGSDFINIPGPIPPAYQGDNQAPNPHFDQRLLGWDDDPNSSQDGTVTWQTSTGHPSSAAVVISALGTTDQSFSMDIGLPTSPGELIEVSARVKRELTASAGNFALKLLFDSVNGKFLRDPGSPSTGPERFVYDATLPDIGVFHLVKRTVQVPQGLFDEASPATGTGLPIAVSRVEARSRLNSRHILDDVGWRRVRQFPMHREDDPVAYGGDTDWHTLTTNNGVTISGSSPARLRTPTIWVPPEGDSVVIYCEAIMTHTYNSVVGGTFTPDVRLLRVRSDNSEVVVETNRSYTFLKNGLYVAGDAVHIQLAMTYEDKLTLADAATPVDKFRYRWQGRAEPDDITITATQIRMRVSISSDEAL